MGAFLLSRSLDKLTKHKIISVSISFNTIWNVPAECENALASIYKKHTNIFCVRYNRLRGFRKFSRFNRGSKLITKKASIPKPHLKQDKK